MQAPWFTTDNAGGQNKLPQCGHDMCMELYFREPTGFSVFVGLI